MLHMSAMLCCVYARVSIQQLTCSCYRWIHRGGGGGVTCEIDFARDISRAGVIGETQEVSEGPSGKRARWERL
jgi:hypothetical protein